jgi:hypothetical protein
MGPIKIAPTDLVEINIGGNDARQYYQTGGTLAGVPGAAATSATNAINGINALVGDGARTIVFTVGDVSKLPEAAGFANAAVGSAYSQTYNNLMQIALAGVARSGVRVEYIDTGLLGTLIQANPARYGFTNTGACPVACIGNPTLQNQYLFYVDQIHLTSHGFAVFGEYIVNRLNAPLTFAPQGDVATISALGFASTLFGRLDLFRETYGFAPSTMNAYAADMRAPYTKAPPLVAVSPWSFYMQGNGGISDRQATVASNGFNLDSVGGTIAVEYRSNANSFVGAAFDYSNPKASLLNNAGTADANSYQLGFYGGWANSHFFAQGLATVGQQDFRNTRPGVVDTITSNPDGTTFVVAGKTGYLFDAGKARSGRSAVSLIPTRGSMAGSRRSRVDPERRPADRRSADRQRRRAIPHAVRGQWTSYQPLSQSDSGRRFYRQWPDHPIQRDVGAIDRQQLGDPERHVAERLRPGDGRRRGPRMEQCVAHRQRLAHLRPPGRR